jgi:DNA-binding Lrp family transcriptional regulator
MDRTDKALISALQADGRASITYLAATLRLSRATVQTRLERLQQSGTIRRFTVELNPDVQPELIRAVMLVQLQGNLARKVIATLRKMPEIMDLHTTNGAWDLVAHLETRSLPEFDQILRKVREVPGVLNSETCLLLNRV